MNTIDTTTQLIISDSYG